ncbi:MULTISPECIES: type II secretion system F family protein [unclassified Caballeronia]|uniref:type II secretion system F family protein n=1 Tax=unclassified Caballeronia TaxID=2646786 RepID=UPI002028F269|nr:type II secretion system F family protein [Caballeronia sp. LZ001]MDR5805632.1 type II secretion system F family protein [Caballeronia sp. LZ001]
MSSGIALVCMIAVLCAASGMLLWMRGLQKRDARLAQHFFTRQMQTAGTQTPLPPLSARVAQAQHRQAGEAVAPRSDVHRAIERVMGELGALFHRASVRKPRAALTMWAAFTGVAALVCWTRIGMVMALVAIAMSAVGFYAILTWRAQKRNQRIVRQLPSFLEGIVRLVTIGNSVPAAFQGAAASADDPLRECLDQVMPRLKGGADIDQALTAVARMYRVEQFELIGSVLRISVKFGGRSDVMLERMAAFMRDLEQADRELVALSTETRLSSWVLGSLPVGLGAAIILLNPAYFDAMWTDVLGKKLVYGAFALQTLGAFLLYRLARLRD